MTKNKEPKRRRLEGVVTGDKMVKTVVVTVSREKIHSKYLKHFRVSKRFKAHDENREYHVGDKVVIEETRPISKEKRWRVVSRLTKDFQQRTND